MASGCRALVLGYHDVVSSAQPMSGFTNPEAARYKTAEADFRRHLDVLAADPAVVPGTVGCAREMPIGADFRGLTFDDGGANGVLIADLLEERGWRGHFFVVVERIGTPGFLTPRQVIDLAARGHVVGSHSWSHPSMMAKMSPAAMREEWTRSVQALQDILAGPVRTASVPGGSTSPTVESVAAASGVEVLFTSEPTSRVVRRDGCLVIGRYQLYGTEPAEVALAIARGDRAPRLRRAASWGTRRAAQRVLGKNYLRLRRALLG